MKFLVTATVQKVVDREDAEQAGFSVDYSLKGWLRDNREDSYESDELDRVLIEGIAELTED